MAARSFSRVVAAGCFTLLAGAERPARACGGCFHPQTETTDTTVTGHRMAFAISANRTVLWDQIQYSGSPKEFGWVLPVRRGATIEASTDAWFEALEAATAVRVVSPTTLCAPSGANDSLGGCGCGSMSANAAAYSKGGPQAAVPPVSVLHQGTVGPYETVTLSSADGSALRGWLGKHGYVVPPDIGPIIDAYVKEGADFIALRLQPGQGIDRMTPVRVVTPGGSPILPLRMVAAGTGPLVDIVLYVIGEGRYGLLDLTETQVNLTELTYDFKTSDSNFVALRDQALADEHLGASYVTAYAHPDPFGRAPTPDPGGFGSQDLSDTAGRGHSDLGGLYFGQAVANGGGKHPECASFTPPPWTRYGGWDQPLRACSARRSGVPDGGARDGGIADAGMRDASLGGADASARGCLGALVPTAGDFTCGPFTDIAAALTGLTPSKVWMTRLEMNLPHDQLTMDCRVGSAASGDVSNQVLAPKGKNNPCPIVKGDAGVASNGTAFPATMGSFLALALGRKRRKRGAASA